VIRVRVRIRARVSADFPEVTKIHNVYAINFFFLVFLPLLSFRLRIRVRTRVRVKVRIRARVRVKVRIRIRVRADFPEVTKIQNVYAIYSVSLVFLPLLPFRLRIRVRTRVMIRGSVRADFPNATKIQNVYTIYVIFLVFLPLLPFRVRIRVRIRIRIRVRVRVRMRIRVRVRVRIRIRVRVRADFPKATKIQNVYAIYSVSLVFPSLLPSFRLLPSLARLTRIGSSRDRSSRRTMGDGASRLPSSDRENLLSSPSPQDPEDPVKTSPSAQYSGREVSLLCSITCTMPAFTGTDAATCPYRHIDTAHSHVPYP
jgi:hypothetical protein